MTGRSKLTWFQVINIITYNLTKCKQNRKKFEINFNTAGTKTLICYKSMSIYIGK